MKQRQNEKERKEERREEKRRGEIIRNRSHGRMREGGKDTQRRRNERVE